MHPGLFRNRSQDASADEQLQCGAVRPDASRNSRGRGSKGNQEKRKHTGDCAYCQRHLDDKVEYLRSGADDYITKPFDIQEVLARVLVQIRRNEGQAEAENLCYQGMELDKTNFCVRVEGTELSKITKQEFSILELLLRHPKKVFSKEEIFEYAWEEAYMGETKTLDVHISNIRKKIKEVTKKEYIETVWGIGYRLHP